MSGEQSPFEGWAILELMGHRRLAGYLTEVQLAGTGFLRLDVPPALAGDDEDPEAGVTQFYAAAAVYAITPTTEQVVRAIRVKPEPVQAWELPRQLPASSGEIF